MRRILLVLVCATAAPGAASAQAPPPENRVELAASLEIRRDRFAFHFDNPSSFDTPFLVPHFFEQRYIADNVWAQVSARYSTGPIRWETSAGATPRRTATADDYDTFVNPGGAIWVSGTTGDATVHSWRLLQRWELAGARGVTLTAGYRLQLDRADFGIGHKTVTRNDLAVSAFDVTSPESTSTQLHEVFVGVRSAANLGVGWRLRIDGELAPGALARLAVQLPEKYPGETLVFIAKVASGTARVTFARDRGAWPIEVSLDAGRTWSYSSDARFTRTALGARIGVGHTWRSPAPAISGVAR